jgi:hypothetical protein
MAKIIRKLICQWVVVLLMTACWTAYADETQTADRPTLVKAVMCESIQNYEPVNSAVVFSIELGRVSCYTKFDPVPKKTFIHHKWYRNDILITVKRLTINPPSWASFTSVQLRDADKGPWRVVITDEEDNIMQTLRFSISD